MKRYSFFALLRHGLSGNRSWHPAWRTPQLRPSYDVVIVGGGGHGLATAYYLARKHGVRSVAVIEKGAIGLGNSGRNTQVTRSNYFHPESIALFDHSLRLYEGLSRELNFNVMLRQDGLVQLALGHHEWDLLRRWRNSIRMCGVDAVEMSASEIKRRVPLLNLNSRVPVIGGYVQERAGISRHDAVVWGMARAADSLGADIVQGCEVLGLQIERDRVVGVDTSLGRVSAGKVVLAAAAHSSMLAAMAGIRLPITTMALQAMVSEPVRPVLDVVVDSSRAYLSQSDRGEIVIGAGADVYNSFAQRGSLAVMRETIAAVRDLFPSFARLRLMRQWAGAVDVTPDSCPIMGLTAVRNLYLNCGWGSGGYKAIPAGGDTTAHTVIHDEPHPLIAPFSLQRFERCALVHESIATGVAH